jgi:NADH-quinone oxidoreductase subunit J
MQLTSVLFYIIAAIILFTALNMVLSKNLVHSILFMVATFIGIAFVYVLLQADYLAVVQILVYVGAISVMFVFGVMLTRRDSMSVSNRFNRYAVFAGLAAVAILLLFGRIILMTGFNPAKPVPAESTIIPISSLLLNDYIIPFEISGVLLLVSMIGAIIIGKGVKHTK